jgi:hypothetical protein
MLFGCRRDRLPIRLGVVSISDASQVSIVDARSRGLEYRQQYYSQQQQFENVFDLI